MVIYLSGSINAGKTTVAKLLVELIPRRVDRDRRTTCTCETIAGAVHQAITSRCRRFGRKLASARFSFHSCLADLAGRPRGIYSSRFQRGCISFDSHSVPKYEIVKENRGNRELTDWERERIRYHYAIGIHKPSFGNIIDNAGESPQQTADRIVQILRPAESH